MLFSSILLIHMKYVHMARTPTSLKDHGEVSNPSFTTLQTAFIDIEVKANLKSVKSIVQPHGYHGGREVFLF